MQTVFSNSVLILKRAKNIFPCTDIKCSDHLAAPEAQKKCLVSIFRCFGKDMPRVNIILPLLIRRTTVQSLQTTFLAFLIFPKYLPESPESPLTIWSVFSIWYSESTLIENFQSKLP